MAVYDNSTIQNQEDDKVAKLEDGNTKHLIRDSHSGELVQYGNINSNWSSKSL